MATMSFYVDGKLIQPGTKMKDFRGEKVRFVAVTRDADVGGPSSGRILVQDGWGKMNGEGNEYFPSVLDGELSHSAPEPSPTVVKAKVTKKWGEYIVKAWAKDEDGRLYRYEDADYFTDDRDDAFDTAQAMVQA